LQDRGWCWIGRLSSRIFSAERTLGAEAISFSPRASEAGATIFEVVHFNSFLSEMAYFAKEAALNCFAFCEGARRKSYLQIMTEPTRFIAPVW
jgi:hypothetical protein